MNSDPNSLFPVVTSLMIVHVGHAFHFTSNVCGIGSYITYNVCAHRQQTNTLLCAYP